MIDGGALNKVKGLLDTLESISGRPEEIKLIMITHGHWDHIGSAKDIKEITGAKIAMHRLEKDWLEKSLKPLPPGVTTRGRILIGIQAVIMPLIHIPATDVDVVLGDEELSLAEYGIPSRVIHTPGHSMGSVSILMKIGEAFVGDLAMNMLPLCFSPSLPIFAEDIQKLKESWKVLLDEGAEIIYPALGKPFPADIIRKAIS